MALRFRSFVFLGVVLLVSLGCLVFNAPETAVPQNTQTAPPVDIESIRKVAQTEIALSQKAQPTLTQLATSQSTRTHLATSQPTSKPANDLIHDVDIDYTYTDSIVTALYHLYGSVLDNFVDISITNRSSKDVSVVVLTEVTGYTTPEMNTVKVSAGKTVEIHQNPRLMAEAIDKLNSEKPGVFHIRVVSLENGKETLLLEETQQILLYSRRDFVWLKGFEWQEQYELWAAWVTPTDPEVEALIRKAADYTKGGKMWSGYGDHVNDDDGGVWDRLQAIWKAEQNKYNLTYISTMVAFGPNTVQRMRLPNEVLKQSSGNCVELAALFASAAEALGLEAAIVRIPGHAYTAIRTDEKNAKYYFVETTMIGQHSFSDAVSYGEKEWNDALPHFEAKEEGYAWVTIPDMREKGILPIPWN